MMLPDALDLEVGFDAKRPFRSLWVKVALMFLDIILDFNTIFLLLACGMYPFAFAMTLVISYTIMHQVSEWWVGKLG